ncbi:MAG: hypothetical protein ACRD1T_12215, partial [Acidimicrobiia bacterium]
MSTARPVPARVAARNIRRRLLLLVDRVREASTPQRVRKAVDAVQRVLGLTRSGQVAALAAIALWLVAFLIAGTALYIVAYGSLFLVLASLALAPRNLKLEGSREGLYPRAQEGDRLDVEVKLTAHRRVSTFVLEERVPERLGRT